MRLIVGYHFMMTRWGKLNNLEQVTQNFIGWGIPFPKDPHPLRVRRRMLRRRHAASSACSPIPAAMLGDHSWSRSVGNGATSIRWRRC